MNEVISKLVSLGFQNSSLIDDKDDTATVRIRTSRGWTYERFKALDEVDSWSFMHEPEEA